MFNDRQFTTHAFLLMILGFLLMFFYVGLQTDHLNVLTPYLQATYGWSDLAITNPVTAAALVGIVLYLVIGAAYVKYGVKKILVPSILVLALGCVGIAIAGENYPVYAVSVFVVRATVIPLLLGAFLLCANWFIKYRGRVLGVVTAGAPFFSIIGIAAMTWLTNEVGLGMNVYLVIAAILVGMSAITALGIRDTPEDSGLYPDGADHRPLSEEGETGEPITVRQLLSETRAWQLIISYGIMQFVIVAMMAYMAVRYISLSTPEDVPNLFVSQALIWLSVGAASGIPMSYVIGWIDDKLGSIKASLVLNILFFFAVVPLALMPEGGNRVLMVIWAFGVACMTGGVPTMHPCITSYVYGRKHYMEANKWLMTIQAIPLAFAIAFMAAFNDAGMLTYAYYVLMGLLVVSFITIVTMRNIPDANAADRDYAS